MSNKARAGIAVLVLSAAGLLGITGSEGFTEKAVVPVAGDVPTIGHGSTRRPDGSPVRMGDTITRQEALIWAKADIARFESTLKRCVTVPLTPGEYDAYVSLAYNIGPGAFCKSTLVRKLNAGDYPGACAEIKRWDKMGGKRLRGLTARREREYRQCVGE